MKRHLLSIVFSVLALSFATQAQAQDSEKYPSRPVRIVVPFAPGGASDFVARILQPRLVKELGEQVVIDNRAGASGNVGVQVAAEATPDGYTLLLGNIGAMAINPSVFPHFPVRPLRDFIPLTQVVDVPTVLAAHPSVPADSVAQFIAYAKAHPGKLNFGSAGVGSNGTLQMDSFMEQAGIKLVQIPYKGGAGAANLALISGEVQVGILSIASVIPNVRAGRLKALAVAAPHRVPALPSVPTMGECGYPNLTTGSWQGVYVPKGTPRPIVEKLFAIFRKVMADPGVVKALSRGGTNIVTSQSPEAFAAFNRQQTEFFGKLVKQVGAVQE